MLTVADVVEIEGLGLSVAAGADGLANEVTWLHVSELDDPTAFLGAATALLLGGLAAAYLPARRALRLEPARALRDE